MNKRQKIILIFSIILIAAVVAIGVSLRPGGGDVDTDSEAEPTATSTEEVGEVSEPGGIPEYTKQVDEEVKETKPEEVIDVTTNPEKDESLGGYTVVASRSGYSPDVLTVVQGNIVRLTLKAEDDKYDLAIPAMSVHLSAPEGKKKQTSFRVPQSGTFRFECQSSCPSGGAIYGQLIVKPRD